MLVTIPFDLLTQLHITIVDFLHINVFSYKNILHHLLQ